MRRLLPLLVVLAIASADAQPVVSAGPLVSVPVGGMADRYQVGLGVRLAVERPGGRVGWRLAGSAEWFNGDGAPGDAWSVGVTAGPVVRLTEAVRVSAGLGAFNERADGRSPYPVVPAAEVGVGVAFPSAPVAVEARALVVGSDLLSGSEFTPSVRVPVSLSVRF